MDHPASMPRPSPRVRAIALVVAVLAAHLFLSWRWSRANGCLARPAVTEATPYRLKSARLLVALQDGGLPAWIEAAHVERDSHTPLLSMVGSLFGWIGGGGVSPTAMWATMTFFAWLLGLGTYRLARSFVDPGPAAAVMALTLASPIAQAYQRDYLPTLPMVALLVWSLDALVRSDFLGRASTSARFGVLAGLATFAKVIAPLYLVGPALVAVLVGLRRSGQRALGGLLLAGVGFTAVTGAWAACNLGGVLDYTDRIVGEKGVDSVQAATSPDRWIHYPREVINKGYGFPLGVVVVAAACWSLFSSRGRKAWSARAWALVAVVLVSWAILTSGQTGTGSQYAFLWVPLGNLLLLCALVRVPRPRRRAALGALALLAGSWNLALAQRPITDDRVLCRWHGLELAGGTGQYLGLWLRRLNVQSEPEAEPWPVLEFEDLVLADAGEAVPRIATSHPVLTANMEYEALMERRTIDRVQAPWATALARARPVMTDRARLLAEQRRGPRSLWPLTAVDYFVEDTLFFDPTILREDIESLGITVDVLATREVTERSTVSLLALRKPWRRPSTEPRSVLDEAGVEPVAVEFENGWRLEGVESAHRKAWGDAPVVHLFVAPRPDGSHCRFLLEVENASGRTIWSGWRSVLGSDVQGSLVAVCFDVLPVHASGLRYRVALERRGRPGALVGIRSADRPVEGDRVLVEPSSERASDVRRAQRRLRATLR